MLSLSREMKNTGVLCASQASISICTNMEQAALASSSSATIHLGASPAIDRHNPIITDSRRANINLINDELTTPFSDSPPNNPKSDHEKTSSKISFAKPTSQENANKKKLNDQTTKMKTSAKTFDIMRKNSCVSRPNELVFTPPGSTRHLLSDNRVIELLSDADPILALAPVEDKKSLTLENGQQASCSSSNSASFPPTLDKSSSSSNSNLEQVVILRVSLHCKGCAGKVKKHISKMKGVKSYNIDFAAKKVTVTGEVTPLEVLASISKVKNAQLWIPEKSKPSMYPSSVRSKYMEETKKL